MAATQNRAPKKMFALWLVDSDVSLLAREIFNAIFGMPRTIDVLDNLCLFDWRSIDSRFGTNLYMWPQISSLRMLRHSYLATRFATNFGEVTRRYARSVVECREQDLAVHIVTKTILEFMAGWRQHCGLLFFGGL